MPTQPIRPALDIPDVKEQLRLLVAELTKSNIQLETIGKQVAGSESIVDAIRQQAQALSEQAAVAQEAVGAATQTAKRSLVYFRQKMRAVLQLVEPTKNWLENSSKLQTSLRKLMLPLWFFLFGTPLAIALLALSFWFKPATQIPPAAINNYFIRTADESAAPKDVIVTAFYGPTFDSGSKSKCLAAEVAVACADTTRWISAEMTLDKFLKSHPKPTAWFLQIGHDRDRLGKRAAAEFGSNHGLTFARFEFVKQAFLELPELQSAAQLPPFVIPGYKHEPANKNRDRTPTLYLIWGKEDGK